MSSQTELTLKYINLISDAIRLQEEQISNYQEALIQFKHYKTLNPDSPQYQIWLSMIKTTEQAIQEQLNTREAFESIEFKLVTNQVQEAVEELNNLISN